MERSRVVHRERKLSSRNATRERHRVQSLRDAFRSLQNALPAVPPNTKLSKLDVLILASAYIGHLARLLHEPENNTTHPASDMRAVLHPVKKWPMRSRLYAGLNVSTPGICPCYVATNEATE